ncbi:MAG: ABC transporter permease [Rickettsiales bacterium]|nr:ABC transporter permease [Rickettsiales bacterium]
MNLYGTYVLYVKEVKRFLSVYNQTIIAPLVNSLLLLTIFSLAIGGRVGEVEGIPFKQFIIPGLIMMTIIQNAFANTSSMLTFGKVLGTIIDLLLPPLSPKEVTIAMTLGGVTRGIFSGLAVVLAVIILSFFDETIKISVHNWSLMIFYIFFSSLLLSLFGMLAGIFCDTFDKMSFYTNFIITPLSFLSGTFYSIKNLPEFWQKFNHFNPFFYMIDGFRYSLTGHNDFPIYHGIIMLLICNLILYFVVYTLIKKGVRIKS